MEKQTESKNNAVVQPEIMHVKAWQSIKAKYSNAILLLRIGEYCFTFDNDAFILSSLTGRNSTKHELLKIQCCFPVFQLDIYLNKLIKAGNRVAICDQLVSPP